ncbi:unnamed protein product [Ambrosiozyma monospora]|uniref:Unnamed protein product n=1 Tax=Ambrosiozyma monospora TaxID=43982 RepID=A0ACB5UAZ2_AMBMO|nr:unnamed protein product [Ambrosiozyma monospora]
MSDFIKSNQLDLIYYGVMVMLHLIHDQALIKPFESLRFFDGLDDTDADAMIDALNELIETEDDEIAPEIDFRSCYELFDGCFKGGLPEELITFEKFVKYLILFRLNNYNGSIYLLFATLDRDSGANSTFNSKNMMILRLLRMKMVPLRLLSNIMLRP